jgi:probable rRNA maturation factor
MSILLEFNLQDAIKSDLDIPWTDWFATWLENMAENLPETNQQAGFELSLRLTDDLEIQSLNSTYRSQDKPTDVLAFAALEVKVPEITEFLCDPLYLGDIIISIDTAKKQALEQSHSLSEELAWLASHGLLHLLGWDHPDAESLELMLAKQANLLKSVGILGSILEKRNL